MAHNPVCYIEVDELVALSYDVMGKHSISVRRVVEILLFKRELAGYRNAGSI